MSIILLFLSFFLIAGKLRIDIQNVDLMKVNTFTWNGRYPPDSPHTLNVSAGNYSIGVKIQTCNIGNKDARPNKQYLVLREGTSSPSVKGNGKIFSYITKPKQLYFQQGPVVLELNNEGKLDQDCKVVFQKGEIQDVTLPPVTTPKPTTMEPEENKLSTVYVSGRTIRDYNDNRSLVLQLKEDLVNMATDYVNTDGFCLEENITAEDVAIRVMEQCPSKMLNFRNCIRLVYSVHVKINDSCSLWHGYELTRQHLDVMWKRLAPKYLRELNVYDEPIINNVIVWWLLLGILVMVVLIVVMVWINLRWKRRILWNRSRLTEDDFTPEMRKISELSLTPPYFQSIPPMFDRSNRLEDKRGNDNEGFEYNEVPSDCEENGTTV